MKERIVAYAYDSETGGRDGLILTFRNPDDDPSCLERSDVQFVVDANCSRSLRVCGMDEADIPEQDGLYVWQGRTMLDGNEMRIWIGGFEPIGLVDLVRLRP